MTLRDSLLTLGYPFDRPERRADWCSDAVARNAIQRNAITEKIAAGKTIEGVAWTIGISPRETLEYLVRPPDDRVEDWAPVAAVGEPATLDVYYRHLERFGPELLLATAESDLSRGDLGRLRARVENMSRTHRWRNGEWIPKASENRGER